MDLKKQAQENMKTLCDFLDGEKINYQKESDKVIKFTFIGDDLNIEVKFVIDDERALINLYSELPFKVPQKMRPVIALAVSVINWDLIDGDFDFSFENGSVCFRLTSVYRDSIISKKTFDYMMSLSADTVEKYNDKLFFISQGKMTLTELNNFMMEDK